MQEKEKEGCWFMTKGHVYYQEPVRVMSQIYYSSVLLMRLLGVGGRGRGMGGGSQFKSTRQLFLYLYAPMVSKTLHYSCSLSKAFPARIIFFQILNPAEDHLPPPG
jgi:hypothetical protein